MYMSPGGHPDATINIEGEMKKETATLSVLNVYDNPRYFGGKMLGTDPYNQLWLFGDRVANRFQLEDCIEWSDDVDGWGYSKSDAIDE